MKTLFSVLVIATLALVLLPVGAAAHTESAPMVVDLIAGQTIDVGDVLVWNDAEYLHVKFVATVCLKETHLQVATGLEGIPQTKTGNPIPGQFDYSDSYECVYEKQYDIELADLGGAGTQLFIAAHASTGNRYVLTLKSEEGDTVYGPIYSAPSASTDWGAAKPAVRAYNWIGIDRPAGILSGCEQNPYASAHWTWGWGNDANPTSDPDVPDVNWISTAMDVEVWELDSWRKFVKSFEVPGQPMHATLTVNADDEYVASSTAQIGSDSDIFDGPETYTFDADPGSNTLTFVVRNLGQGEAGSYCDQLRNPTGLTYEAQVEYTASSETAWAAGVGFPGANWATYFTYGVQSGPSEPIDTIMVPSDGSSVSSSVVLAAGKSYTLQAGGTYVYWPHPGSVAGIADAKYSLRPEGSYNPGPGPKWVSGDDLPAPVEHYLEVLVNGNSVAWGPFNPYHIYSVTVAGNNAPLSFNILDTYYDDNSGSIQVQIYALD